MLRAIRRSVELPLLAKELVEMAARKRTYVIRTVCALALFLISLIAVADMLRYRGDGPLVMLGMGKYMVEVLAVCLMTGVYLLLPAVMCPAICAERESGTMTLLLISPLRPWQIVIQKLAARLIPVLSLVMLALPLMAVAYLYGGIESRVVYKSAYLIVLAAVQVGAVGLMCSAFFRTPGGALVATYVVLGSISWLWPGIVWELGWELGVSRSIRDPIAALFCPPLLLAEIIEGGRVNFGLLPHVGSWCSALVALLLARIFLVTRANPRKRNLLLALFRKLDGLFKAMNRVTGNRQILADHRSLPGDAPIAWSELHRRAIGKVRYLFRLFIVIELPVALLALGIVYTSMWGYHRRGQIEELTVIILILWVAYAVILTIIGAGLFATERSRQTLEVLLTTPMATGDIVRQKLAGLTRLRIVLAIPIVTLILVEAWVESGRSGSLQYMVISLFALWVYPSLAIWVAMWIGLRLRKPTRAMITALAVNTLIAIGPVLVAIVISVVGSIRPDEPIMRIAFAAPSFLLLLNEISEIDEAYNSEFIAAAFQLLCWCGVLALVRLVVSTSADRSLGRVVAQGYTAPAAMATEGAV